MNAKQRRVERRRIARWRDVREAEFLADCARNDVTKQDLDSALMKGYIGSYHNVVIHEDAPSR